MKRRDVLAGGLALSLLPFSAFASEMITFKPGVVEEALKAGKTVFIDYATDWCTTCNRQKRIISKLRADNPKYDAAMTFIRVDWDVYANDPISTSHKIPRRSTLLLLRGTEELGRNVAGTSTEEIQALMDKGL